MGSPDGDVEWVVGNFAVGVGSRNFVKTTRGAIGSGIPVQLNRVPQLGRGIFYPDDTAEILWFRITRDNSQLVIAQRHRPVAADIDGGECREKFFQSDRAVNQSGERTVRLIDPAREDDRPFFADTSHNRLGNNQPRFRVRAQPAVVRAVGNAGAHTRADAGPISILPPGIDDAQAVQDSEPCVVASDECVQGLRANAAPGKLLLHFVRHRENGQINLVDGIADFIGDREREVLRRDLGAFLVANFALPQRKPGQSDEEQIHHDDDRHDAPDKNGEGLGDALASCLIAHVGVPLWFDGIHHWQSNIMCLEDRFCRVMNRLVGAVRGALLPEGGNLLALGKKAVAVQVFE